MQLRKCEKSQVVNNFKQAALSGSALWCKTQFTYEQEIISRFFNQLAASWCVYYVSNDEKTNEILISK